MTTPASPAAAQPTPDAVKQAALNAVDRYTGQKGNLLPVLHDIQHTLGYIPDEAVPVLSQALQLSRAEIHGVISFYPHFHAKPMASTILEICRAESCQAMGDKNDKPIGINDSFADWDERIGKVNVWTPTGGGLQTPPLHPNCRCTMIEILDDEDLKTRYEL